MYRSMHMAMHFCGTQSLSGSPEPEARGSPLLPPALTCSELSRAPPGFPMHFRKHLSVIRCGESP